MDDGRTHIRLDVIDDPDPAEATIFEWKGEGNGPVIAGEVPGMSYDCGNCGNPLVIDVEVGQVSNIVFPCPACGKSNLLA